MGVSPAYQTSTLPILVKTDAGNGVLKIPAGCGGTDRLICEFVGSSLARWLGVPTPNFALIRTDSNFVEMMQEINAPLAEEADGFISQYEKLLRFELHIIPHVKNKDIFTQLVFLDTWIRNEDRYFKKTGKLSSRKFGNIALIEERQFSRSYIIKAIDHSEAFRYHSGRLDIVKHFGKQAINDPHVFGLFPEFKQYRNWEVACQLTNRLMQIKESDVQNIFNQIPKSWVLDDKTKKAFIAFIVKRAAFVAENLTKNLFPGKMKLFQQTKKL
jgi:hypothetical protein